MRRIIAAMSPEPLRVYWQPGCTSCLRTKEFLDRRGVAYQSINVLADPAAFAELARLGARSVPVVARGEQFVFAQELSEVARFVGVPYAAERLPIEQLVARLDRLLLAAAELVASFPDARIRETIPSRPRSFADVAFHVGMIVQGFLDAADPQRHGELRYEHFERTPAPEMVGAVPLAGWLQQCRSDLDAWWRRGDPLALRGEVRTYYGVRALHEVLERSAWHVAQHCRQLDFIAVTILKCQSEARVTGELLQGLPVPEDVWDREIGAWPS